MEHYNQLFLQQLSPFILVQLKGIDSEIYNALAENFNQFKINSRSWDNSIIKNRISNPKYIVRVTDNPERVKNKEPKLSDDEYSVLSPFNKDSDLFPNGILSEKWFKKYIEEIPFAVVSTFAFPNTEEEYLNISNELSELKSYYSKMNIHFISLIISGNEDNGKDEHTITQLRNITGLSRGTGLIYLNTSSLNFHRDANVIVASIFSSIKTFANDFYGKIENRIKQRYKKYYTYPPDAKNDTFIKMTPKFLETRNLIKQAIIHQFILPSNLTSSIKLLESAYQNLVIILKENFGFFSDKFLNKDLLLYKQIRLLLDIIAFHIVRGYISIEDPLTALKKHKVHIDNVLDAINGANLHYKWISLQYEWLGDLLSLIPSALLNTGNISKKTDKSVRIMAFLGGMNYSNDFEINIYTNPGQIYLQAYFYQKKNVLNSNDDFYIGEDSGTNLFVKTQKLLTKAQDFFKTTNLKNFGIDEKQRISLSWYIKYMQAEDFYFNNFNIKECSILYEELLKEVDFKSWSNCLTFILKRLIICYNKNKEYNSLLSCFIKLSILGHKGNRLESISLSDLSFGNFAKELEFKDSNFFEIKGYILTQQEAPNTINENGFIIQIQLSSNLNLDILQKLLTDEYYIQLEINKILIDVVSFDNDKKLLDAEDFFKVEIIHDENQPNSNFQSISSFYHDNDKDICKANLSNNSFKVFHIYKENNNYVTAKLLNLKNIVVEATIKLYKGSQQTVMYNVSHKTQDLESNNFSIIDVFTAESFDEAGNFINGASKPVRIKNRLPHTVQIVPLIPNIEVFPKFPSLLSVGEKISIPCGIKFNNIGSFGNKLALLSTKTTIVGEGISNEIISSISTKINWENLKDDIPIQLTNKEEEVNLELVILVSPHYSSQLPENIIVNILFQAFVSDDDNEPNISNSVPYEIMSRSLQVKHELE